MANEYFKAEELPRTGQRIRSKVEFSGVPKGTEGIVVSSWKSASMYGHAVYGVDIQWKRWEGDSLTDGFSKTDYEWGLEEL